MKSINPVDGSVVQTYSEMSDAEVAKTIDASHAAFLEWRRRTFSERAGLFSKLAQRLREKAEQHARLMALEMGKPLKDGIAEIEKCAWACEFYAAQAEQFLAPQPVATDASKSYVTFQPLGVVLAIMPWNFPFWQVLRFAAPSLMAGNVGVLKHASNVCGSALAIEGAFREAGFPAGVFRALLIESSKVDAVIEQPHVKAVTLTGSTQAGKAVAKKAGEMLKKSVLELGGSDPYLVLEDADLKTAVDASVTSRLINSGQSCIAAKRFIVMQSVHEDFTRQFVEKMRQVKMGDPLDPTSQIGPLARRDLRDQLHDQVRQSIQLGAKCLLGGEIPPGPGAFYPPTVLTEVKAGMPAYEEELFGPVAAIIRAADAGEAVRLANDSPFGLGAAVFTANRDVGEKLAAEQLQAGSCFVNALVKSDPRLPFGGIKTSGYGRELGEFGIREFVNIKTVYIK